MLAASTSHVLRGEVVNVACGERTSLNELVRYVGDVVGRRLEPDHRAPRAGDIRDSIADVRAAHDLLGYRPSVDLRAGLKRTYEALLQLAHPQS